MEEELCSRCYRPANQVKLLDAIDNTKIVKICEECAITDEIPVIRKPSTFQLTPSKKPATVYERVSRLSGHTSAKAQQQAQVQEVMKKITSVNKEDKISQLSIKQRQALATKANKPLNLIDNFHWHIQMARRKKKISQLQLAENLGEREEIIKLIEQGKVPDDASKIINKVSQFLGIKLIKQDYELEQARIQAVRQPSRVISFDQESLKSLTIADLIEMKKKKEQLILAEQARESASPAATPQTELHKRLTEQSSEQEKPNENLLGNDIEIIDG